MEVTHRADSCEYYSGITSHCLRQPLVWLDAMKKWLCDEHEARTRRRLFLDAVAEEAARV